MPEETGKVNVLYDSKTNKFTNINGSPDDVAQYFMGQYGKSQDSQYAGNNLLPQQEEGNRGMNKILYDEQHQPFMKNPQGTNPVPSYVGGRNLGSGMIGIQRDPNELATGGGVTDTTPLFTNRMGSNQGLLASMGARPEIIAQAQKEQTQQSRPMDLATLQKAAYADGLEMVSRGAMSMEDLNKAYDARFGKEARETIQGVQKKYEPKTKEDLLDVYGQKEQQKADIANQKLQTKQELKLAAAKPKQKAVLNGVNLTTDILLKSVNELLTMKGADSIFGLVGGYTPNIRGNARDAQAKLNSIVSQLGVRALNDMRAASETGGAVGQVTEREWPILQSQIASLERAQSWKSAQKAMNDIIYTVKRIKKSAQESYSDTYGEVEEPQSYAGEQNPKTVVERRTTASGKKLIKYSDGSIGEE